jgi:multiple sugar transport system substrate-binding protein
MVFGDPAEKAAYETLVAAFHAAHPEIAVELQHIPSQADYRKRLGADFAAGTPADIVLINYRRYGPFAAKGVIEPIGPYLAASDKIKVEDFYEQSIAPYYWEGTLMCIPQNLSSLVVYYNQDLFAAAGLPMPSNDWTWAEFLAAAKALTQDIDGDGVTDIYGLGTDATIFRVAPFIWANGGELVDDPANPTGLALEEPATKEALQWFIDLRVVHGVAPGLPEEMAEASESRFLNGRLGMFLNSRRGVPTYRTIKSFAWDAAPLPVGKAGRAGILHADAFCMAKATEDKDAAWIFIEYANAVEGQTILAASGRTVPSLKAVAESPVFLEPDLPPANNKGAFIDTIPYIRAVPVMDTWVDIEILVSEELEHAFHGESTLDATIDAAVVRTREFWR